MKNIENFAKSAGAGAKCDQFKLEVRTHVHAHLYLDVRGACVRPKWSQLTPCYFIDKSALKDECTWLEFYQLNLDSALKLVLSLPTYAKEKQLKIPRRTIFHQKPYLSSSKV